MSPASTMSSTARPLRRWVVWVIENPARAAVWASVFLLLYQACLPRGLTLDPLARDLDLSLVPSAEQPLIIADIVGNVVPYWVFGHFVYAASWRSHARSARAALVACFGTVLMVVAVESVEYLNLHRGSALRDVASGFVGGVLAIASGAAYVHLVADRFTAWLVSAARTRPLNIAWAFVATSILFDAARPFHVISSGDYLWANIRRSNVIPFRPLGDDIRDQLGITFGTHALAQLEPVERSLDYVASQGERFLPYLALLVVARVGRDRFVAAFALSLLVFASAEIVALGIAGGAFDVTHLCSAALALPLAVLVARWVARVPGRVLYILLALSLAYIVVGDLRPYEFGRAKALSADMFVPLIHHFRDIEVTQLWNLVEGVAVYIPVGACSYAIAVSRAEGSGVGPWPPATWTLVLCGAVSAVLEIAQVWLVDRTPGLEDVVLSMLGGYVGVVSIQYLLRSRGEPIERLLARGP